MHERRETWGTPVKVLVVDDDRSICTRFQELLRRGGYQVSIETDGTKVLDLLREDHVDLVLLDLVMPRISGVEVLRKIKSEFQDILVIVVTGQGSVEAAAQPMQEGASDFVTKPVSAGVLDARIKKAIEHADAKRLAATDALTKLYNFRFFNERLREEVSRATRYHRELAVVMIDIDDFKNYNDLHGHQQGNSALEEISSLLKENVRSSDTVARYGGEEFAIILPETTLRMAELVADRLREKVEQNTFFGEDQLPAQELTISAGVGTHRAGETWERLIERADQALYQAKKSGRNRVQVEFRSQNIVSVHLP